MGDVSRTRLGGQLSEVSRKVQDGKPCFNLEDKRHKCQVSILIFQLNVRPRSVSITTDASGYFSTGSPELPGNLRKNKQTNSVLYPRKFMRGTPVFWTFRTDSTTGQVNNVKFQPFVTVSSKMEEITALNVNNADESASMVPATLLGMRGRGSGGRVVGALAPAAPRSTLCGVVGSSPIAAR